MTFLYFCHHIEKMENGSVTWSWVAPESRQSPLETAKRRFQLNAAPNICRIENFQRGS